MNEKLTKNKTPNLKIPIIIITTIIKSCVTRMNGSGPSLSHFS